MIKRLTAVVIAALMALIPLSGMSTGDSRQLTLMIYMCGSNLESGYGAATADMQEMMASGFDAKKMTVLVMTGGSEAWAQGFDAGQAMIHELGNNRSRTVWSESAMDMGDSATLRSFLRFGQERYPAQRYALILWNHGCGPLDGVCLDELFGMDSLSLRELSQGLADAELGQKLSFIGFDACLMGSLEVACAVSPYAEYMIASQETEPASGWPYGFLPGLVDDETGADTGRRLCDMYMASDVLPGEMLTLSCLDLGKAEAAAAALGEYFSSYTEGWNESLFTRTSALRAASVGYGEGLKGMGDGGYDLVDLGDFTAYLETAGLGGDELYAALDELVVYSRSSGDVGQGLSLYHPMFNKAQYQAAWREEYRQLGF